MRKWHLETWKIEDLVPHEHNPRYLTKEDSKHLKTSISKFGLVEKPIITSDGKIIGGHQRIEILKSMDEEEVECWVCDDEDPFSSEEIDELNIRLNKNTGRWDWDKLANAWDVNKLCNWGFNPEDFEDPNPKTKKLKIVLEFDDVEFLTDALDLIKKWEMYSEDKVKIKGKQ